MKHPVHAIALVVALATTITACTASTSGTATPKAAGTDTTAASAPTRAAGPAPSGSSGDSNTEPTADTSAADTSSSTGTSAAGSPSAASSSVAATGSACALATLPEITAAAGKPMAVSGGVDTICTFSAVGDPSFFIYVQVYNDEPSMATMKQLENTGSEKLTGIGDDAFWIAALGAGFVQKGSRAFSFTLPSLNNLTTNPDAVKSRMVTLAKAAAARF